MEIRKASGSWKSSQQAVLSQFKLFGDQPKALEKLPYTFHYVFECEDSKKPHVAMNEDWELGVLFLKEREHLGSEEAAAQSVRKRFFEEMCREDKDTRFFMGTRFPYNTWLVLGVFWPPVVGDPKQTKLF